ncbi:MAG: DUF1345 domain-containing protein [Solirubrobacteraceae bacterium]
MHRSARDAPVRVQLACAASAGLLAGVIVALSSDLALGVLAGWAVAAALYMLWVWLAIWPLDAAGTRARAAAEDPARATADLMLLGAAIASLVAVGFVLAGAASHKGLAELARIALAVASIAISWGLVHTVYTLRYAQLYYAGDSPRDVDFNEERPASYSDFAYLSFTLGMTFQVSDTDLKSNVVRRTALRHALLSYLFGTGVLATTINLVASLSSK